MIEAMDKTLWDWADKQRGGVAGPLGYAKSTWYRLSGSPASVDSNRALDHAGQFDTAERVEKVIVRWYLNPSMRYLAETVRHYYLKPGTARQKAKDLGITTRGLEKRLHKSHELLDMALRSP